MVVLIDTNIILDFLLTREPAYKAASDIILKCANKEIKGYIAFHSISILWYILRKVPEEKRRNYLIDICSLLQVTATSHNEIIKAINMIEFKDFEDCLQDRCAKNVSADYIITRNTLDFTYSEVPAILPEDFLKILNT